MIHENIKNMLINFKIDVWKEDKAIMYKHTLEPAITAAVVASLKAPFSPPDSLK
jgi:rRNA-processing protein FCF1